MSCRTVWEDDLLANEYFATSYRLTSASLRECYGSLHYRLKLMEQDKLVYVISGRVYDVAVDIRRGSPWFGRYVGVVLEPGYALYLFTKSFIIPYYFNYVSTKSASTIYFLTLYFLNTHEFFLTEINGHYHVIERWVFSKFF